MQGTGTFRIALALALCLSLSAIGSGGARTADALPLPAIGEIPGRPIPFTVAPGVMTTVAAGADAVYSVNLLAYDIVTIKLTSGDALASIAPQPLDLYLFPPGATTVKDRSACVAQSTLAGTAEEIITFRVPPGAAGTYYIDVRSMASVKARFQLTCTLTSRLTSKASLTPPTHPSTVKAGSYFTSSGSLKPRHAAGASSVIIRCYHYEGGGYRLIKSVKAYNSNYSTYTRYSRRISLPSKGLWKLKAYAPLDSKHMPSFSAYSTTSRVY